MRGMMLGLAAVALMAFSGGVASAQNPFNHRGINVVPTYGGVPAQAWGVQPGFGPGFRQAIPPGHRHHPVFGTHPGRGFNNSFIQPHRGFNQGFHPGRGHQGFHRGGVNLNFHRGGVNLHVPGFLR